jgi:hypothetical protein
MIKHYLDIDYKNICFYEYSGEAQEGFIEHTNGAGTVSYRKLYEKGVFGVLQSVSLVDTKHQGKKLVFRMLLGEDIYLAGFSLNDQRGGFDNRFIEPIIAMLPNLVKEQAYRIYPWAMESDTAKKKDGSPRVNYGVSIKKADLDTLTVTKDDADKVKPKFVRRKKDDVFNAALHLPDLEFVKELGAWKPTAVSVDDRRSFLVKLLEKGLVDLGYVPTGDGAQTPAQSNSAQQPLKPAQAAQPAAKQPVAAAPKAEPVAQKVEATVATPAEIAAPAIEVDDYDDLPF